MSLLNLTVRGSEDDPVEQAAPPPYSSIVDLPAPSAPPTEYMYPYPDNTPDVARSTDYENYGSIPSSPTQPPVAPSSSSQLAFNPHIPFDSHGRVIIYPTHPVPPPPPIPYTPDRLRRRRNRGCCATYCTWTCFVFLLFFVVLKLSVTFAPKCTYRSVYQSEPVSLEDIDEFYIEVTGTPSSGSWINFSTSDEPYFQTKVLTPDDDAEVKWTVADRRATLKVRTAQVFFAPCVAVQITASLPRELKVLNVVAYNTAVNFQNGSSLIHEVNVATSNAHISHSGNFQAKRWFLRTSNAKIDGTFVADIVDLETSNAEMNVNVLNATTVSVFTANGRINGRIEGKETVNVATDNASINLDSVIGNDIKLGTSNGKIIVAKLDVQHRFKATTSNSAINVAILRAGDNAVIETKTSNAANTVSLPNRYGAHFSLYTTHGSATVDAKKGSVDYDLDSSTIKEGTKYTQDKSAGNLNISVQTSNANCELRFL